MGVWLECLWFDDYLWGLVGFWMMCFSVCCCCVIVLGVVLFGLVGCVWGGVVLCVCWGLFGFFVCGWLVWGSWSCLSAGVVVVGVGVFMAC